MSEAKLDVKGKAETAFQRVLEPFQTDDLGGWALVWRFFGRREKTPLISVVCGSTEVTARAEDGTPVCFELPVAVSARSHQRDADKEEHDAIHAAIAAILFDGDATCAGLNAAMSDEQFQALQWDALQSVEDSVDDGVRTTACTGRLTMTPWKA